jgi:hypothetical protein
VHKAPALAAVSRFVLPSIFGGLRRTSRARKIPEAGKKSAAIMLREEMGILSPGRDLTVAA